MAKLKHSIQPFFGDSLSETRRQRQLTQESMAELLLISSRAYRELEKGRCSCSAATLILFLAQIPAEDAERAIHDWAGTCGACGDKVCDGFMTRTGIGHESPQ